MRIDVVASDLPGRSFHGSCGLDDGAGGLAGDNVHVGVQVKQEVVDLVVGDAAGARWSVDVEVKADGDVRGPAVHGKRGERFLYLSWGVVDGSGHFGSFRRAKLMLGAVPADVWTAARASGVLTGHLGLTMKNGTPLCAAVRPPVITWTAGQRSSETDAVHDA